MLTLHEMRSSGSDPRFKDQWTEFPIEGFSSQPVTFFQRKRENFDFVAGPSKLCPVEVLTNPIRHETSLHWHVSCLTNAVVMMPLASNTVVENVKPITSCRWENIFLRIKVSTLFASCNNMLQWCLIESDALDVFRCEWMRHVTFDKEVGFWYELVCNRQQSNRLQGLKKENFDGTLRGSLRDLVFMVTYLAVDLLLVFHLLGMGIFLTWIFTLPLSDSLLPI